MKTMAQKYLNDFLVSSRLLAFAFLALMSFANDFTLSFALITGALHLLYHSGSNLFGNHFHATAFTRGASFNLGAAFSITS